MKFKSVGFQSALIYTGISIITSGLFFIVTLIGDYNWLTRVGGALWVFLLSMIISMPLVTPLVKRRLH